MRGGLAHCLALKHCKLTLNYFMARRAARMLRASSIVSRTHSLIDGSLVAGKPRQKKAKKVETTTTNSSSGIIKDGLKIMHIHNTDIRCVCIAS